MTTVDHGQRSSIQDFMKILYNRQYIIHKMSCRSTIATLFHEHDALQNDLCYPIPISGHSLQGSSTSPCTICTQPATDIAAPTQPHQIEHLILQPPPLELTPSRRSWVKHSECAASASTSSTCSCTFLLSNPCATARTREVDGRVGGWDFQ
jgi:hypothetical protein